MGTHLDGFRDSDGIGFEQSTKTSRLSIEHHLGLYVQWNAAQYKDKHNRRTIMSL